MSKFDDYKKWNDYEIGNIPFVGSNPHERQFFVNYVLENNYQHILECGPGELVEYKKIKSIKQVNYNILEVSDLFISNCKKIFPEINIMKGAAESFISEKKYDLVYGSSVIEHFYNVQLGLSNLLKSSRNFFFSLFKWSHSGDLTSQYNTKKKYWTSVFNIDKLLDYINTIGVIRFVKIIKTDGVIEDYNDYKKIIDTNGIQRNGYRLIIEGSSLS